MTAYFAPAVRRQRRRLAADRDTTLQALLGEAVNDLFANTACPSSSSATDETRGRSAVRRAPLNGTASDLAMFRLSDE